jgi:hypothetical protein
MSSNYENIPIEFKTEIEDVINTKTLTDASKKTYRQNFNKIFQKIQSSIKEADQAELFLIINDLTTNLNSKLTYLNIPILIKTYYHYPVNYLTDIREALMLERDQIQKEPIKILDLPPYSVINNFVNELYNIDKRKFIVNYLTLHYGVRNKDVDVFITTKDDVKNFDNELNYLVVKNNEIEWIRNDYKTSKTYGQQRHKIKNQQFIDAVKSLRLNTYLLSSTDKPVLLGSLNNMITNMLYKHNLKNLNESDYFKINIAHLQSKPNSYTKILALGQHRGTDPKTIEAYYNVVSKRIE